MLKAGHILQNGAMLSLLCLALRREGQGGEGKAREEKGKGGRTLLGHPMARCSAVCKFRWRDLVESWSCGPNIRTYESSLL